MREPFVEGLMDPKYAYERVVGWHEGYAKGGNSGPSVQQFGIINNEHDVLIREYDGLVKEKSRCESKIQELRKEIASLTAQRLMLTKELAK